MGSLLELQAKVFLASSAKKKLIKKKPSPKDGKDAVEMLTSPMLRSEGEVGQVHSTCYMVISGLVAESLDTHQLLCVLQAVNKSLSSLSLETLFHVAFQSCVKIIKALDSKKPTNSDDLLVVDSLRAKAQLKLSSQKVSSGAKSTIGQSVLLQRQSFYRPSMTVFDTKASSTTLFAI
eukprot:TRINITY_DN286_c0_g2_i8.p1 TRINITY_DN286_c0_g2~~TRINITY_DN286_c0_g2_i8.p1  ORF type:complete len:177 (+),score=27.25 TRINITY_DN286_c0_g2_i8:473-1003(+)